ncbi:hypothetical protein PROFUN_04063 [Planoprotostelium fungivorum]|uniref:Uncharacterized protein n=1 Tax=Planoprotostelium fungivorum TaxID=1890364 RepID=A0A2P6NJG1_9EUKA|nr:hypothetical protein PROFUN_04063 [Planoprotostelium fungivorum]
MSEASNQSIRRIQIPDDPIYRPRSIDYWGIPFRMKLNFVPHCAAIGGCVGWSTTGRFRSGGTAFGAIYGSILGLSVCYALQYRREEYVWWENHFEQQQRQLANPPKDLN